MGFTTEIPPRQKARLLLCLTRHKLTHDIPSWADLDRTWHYPQGTCAAIVRLHRKVPHYLALQLVAHMGLTVEEALGPAEVAEEPPVVEASTQGPVDLMLEIIGSIEAEVADLRAAVARGMTLAPMDALREGWAKVGHADRMSFLSEALSALSVTKGERDALGVCVAGLLYD